MMLDLTIDELLTTTRTVRKRLDTTRPVPLETVKECLNLALQAPAGGARQRWRWLILTDPEVRAQVAALYREVSRPVFEANRDHAETEATRKAYEGALHLSDILADVPVNVIALMPGRVEEEDTPFRLGYYGSIIPAVWSFQLALRSRGLASAYTTALSRAEPAVQKLLGVPEHMSIIAMIPVAYPRGENFRPAVRSPIEEVAYFNHWKQPEQ